MGKLVKSEIQLILPKLFNPTNGIQHVIGTDEYSSIALEKKGLKSVGSVLAAGFFTSILSIFNLFLSLNSSFPTNMKVYFPVKMLRVGCGIVHLVVRLVYLQSLR